MTPNSVDFFSWSFAVSYTMLVMRNHCCLSNACYSQVSMSQWVIQPNVSSADGEQLCSSALCCMQGLSQGAVLRWQHWLAAKSAGARAVQWP